MIRYALWRILMIIPVLFGVSIAVFMMLHVLPADPVQTMLVQTSVGQVPNAAGTEQLIAQLRQQLGLDRPLYIQFFDFLWNVLNGSFGHSYRSQQPVSDLLLSQYPYTIRLALSGLVCALVLGLGLGIISGLTPGSLVDRLCTFVALLGISAPGFWLGFMLIYLFAIVLNVLPVIGTGSPAAILLPAVTLGLPGAAIIARLTRSNLIALLKEDFIVTARAKGLPETMITLKHALPNVLLPVLTVVGLQFGNLMTGTVIVETVFSRPGIGRLGVTAILQSDYPVVQGFALVVAGTYAVVNLLVDLAYASIDPRIRYD
jgi:ABC-type dipeptide/oligopeptide/nickel transport system permease component